MMVLQSTGETCVQEESEEDIPIDENLIERIV